MQNYYQELIKYTPINIAKDIYDKCANYAQNANLYGLANDVLYHYKKLIYPMINVGFIILLLEPIVMKYQENFKNTKKINFFSTSVAENNTDFIEQEFWENAPIVSNEYKFKNKLHTPNFIKSYTDSSRTNFISKYSYNKKAHFTDCIMQYQGKHDSKLTEKQIEEFKEYFANKPVTKNKIITRLKELKYSKNYEDVHLLYSLITNTKLPNISHLEKMLLNDFDKFVLIYNQENISRKNFINVQFLLYQFLRRYNYDISTDEFYFFKTLEIKKMYDEICSKIFNKLFWNYFYIT